MSISKSLVGLLPVAIAFLLLSVSIRASADGMVLNTETTSVLEYLTDKDSLENNKYTGPSVEEKIVKMDTDKNGFADVFEVRAYLVAVHGSDYQKDLLDKWEASASGKSCSTPFAKALTTDKPY